MARRGVESAQPRHVRQRQHDHHESAVRPTDVGQSDAAYPDVVRFQVLMVRSRRSAVRTAGLAACGSALLTWALSAQQTPPTFRATSHLIVHTVSVKDKQGKPIEGLTAKDFIVTEDNVRQD